MEKDYFNTDNDDICVIDRKDIKTRVAWKEWKPTVTWMFQHWFIIEWMDFLDIYMVYKIAFEIAQPFATQTLLENVILLLVLIMVAVLMSNVIITIVHMAQFQN